MAKKFKKHMMYGPKGKSKMANTYKEHLALKNKGYGHTKPGSPLKINQALIENYKGVNKYTRQGSGTRAVEWDPEKVDRMYKPMYATAKDGLDESYLRESWKNKPKEKEDSTNQETSTNEDSSKKREEINWNDLFEDDSTSDSGPNPGEESTPPSTESTPPPPPPSTPQPKKEKETESIDYGYSTPSEEGLTREQHRLAGSAQPTRLNVLPVYSKVEGSSRRQKNPNMVSVNGKEMSIDEWNELSSVNTTRRGSVSKDTPYGSYDYSGSLDKNWYKEKSPSKYSPFKYYSKKFTNRGKTPLYFNQQAVPSASDPILHLQMQNPNIERDVDKYIANTSLVGDEKLDILGAQANSQVFNYAKQLKDQANMIIDQEGNNKIVNDSINTLRGLTQKINNLVDKKAEWIENNGGNESTKRMFSKGSSGKNKFMQNAIFSERDDLYKMILPLPEVTVGGDTRFNDVQFAFGDFETGNRNIPAIVNSSDIFENVFMKPEGKFADFRKAAVKMAEDSKNRKPYNHYHSEVIVNGLLDSKENVLAFAWDDFAGPSFVEQYTDANPNEDPTWMDVDSPNFNENRLRDELSFWLSKKLQREHQMARKNNEIFDEIEKMTTDQLIAKYSK